MITVNPRVEALENSLIEAYRRVAPATLGHLLQTGMDAGIQALWRPVKLVGPALTVRSYGETDGTRPHALEIARPGDIVVINRGGDLRHANWGEFATVQAMEAGVAGVVTDGVVTDRAALERMRFPAFCRGVSATTVKALGVEEGAINVPVHVGGVVVSPGDLVLADDDGVMVVSPERARELLAFCLEKERWEEFMREGNAAGRTYADLAKERPSPKPPRR